MDDFQKTGYAVVWWVVRWHLKAMSNVYNDWIQGAFWKNYMFTCAIDADIQEGDRVTIDSIEYDCQGESMYSWILHNHKRVLLIKK